MTRRAGIFGYPISHSISPPMHQAAFDHAGISATYEAWETRPEELDEGVRKLRADTYLGANVTVPHKQAVMEHLDEIDELATSIGAVNTITNHEGKLMGANTDALGFIGSLQAETDMEPRGLNVLVVGAGGAARAAAHVLADAEVRSIIIANRTLKRAASLASEIAAKGVDASAIGLSDSRFTQVCTDTDLLVNSTSVGMLHGPAEGESPIPSGSIARGCVVYDMVYNPPLTPLLSDAVRAGAVAVGGLTMLVHQGAAAWTMWTGVEAPIEVMYSAARRALGL